MFMPWWDLVCLDRPLSASPSSSQPLAEVLDLLGKLRRAHHSPNKGGQEMEIGLVAQRQWGLV